jgi:hypothetical protein
MHREDLDLVTLAVLVEHPIVPHDDLSQARIAELWHPTTDLGVASEDSHCVDHTPREIGCVGR